MKRKLSEWTKGAIVTLRQKRLLIVTVLLIGAVSLGAAWSGIASARGLDIGQGVSGFFQVNDLEECLDIPFIGMTDNGDGTSTWTYSVERQPCDQELEAWMIEIPACSLVASASPAPYEVVFPDPNLNKDVVSWNLSPDFESGEFSVTLAGDLVEGQATAGLSASAVGAESLIVEGPQCDPSLAVSTVDRAVTVTESATLTESPAETGVVPETPTGVPFETATETQEESGLQAVTATPIGTGTPPSALTPTESQDLTATQEPSATATPILPGTALPTTSPTPVITGTPSTDQPPAVFLDGTVLVLHYVADSNQTQTINCDNGAVIVSGNSNEITVSGACGMVVLQGDQNQVNLDASALISNSGTENVVSVLGPVLSPTVEESSTPSATPGTGTPTATPSGTPGSTSTPTPGSTSTPTLPIGSTPTPGATSTESIVPSPTEEVTPTQP